MNKLYALPISLFLLHPIFAEDIQSNPPLLKNEVAIVQPEIAHNERRDDPLEIDPLLLQELQAEIAAIIEEERTAKEEIACSEEMLDEEEEAFAKEEITYSNEEMLDEEEEAFEREAFADSEVGHIPAPPRAQHSISRAQAPHPQKSDEQLADVAPGSHIRRFTTQPSQAPAQQEEIAEAAPRTPALKKQPQASRRQAAQPSQAPAQQEKIAEAAPRAPALKKQPQAIRRQAAQPSQAPAQQEEIAEAAPRTPALKKQPHASRRQAAQPSQAPAQQEKIAEAAPRIPALKKQPQASRRQAAQPSQAPAQQEKIAEAAPRTPALKKQPQTIRRQAAQPSQAPAQQEEIAEAAPRTPALKKQPQAIRRQAAQPSQVPAQQEEIAEAAPRTPALKKQPQAIRRQAAQPSQAPAQQEEIAEAAPRTPALKNQPQASRRQAAQPLKTPPAQRERASPQAEQSTKKRAPQAARSQMRQNNTADAQAEQPSQSAQEQQPAPRKTPEPRVQSPEATQPAPAQGRAKPKQVAPTKKPDVKVQAPPAHKQNEAPARNAQARVKSSKRAPSAVAQSNTIATSPAPQSNTQPAPEAMPKMNDKMYNAAVRPILKNGYNLSIVGDALLWQAVEENLTYVYSGNDTPTQSTRNLHTVDFNWDWGFRLGAGYNAPRDGWDFDLYWTHIRNTADAKQRTRTNEQLYQVWSTASIPFPGTISDAKAHWQVNLDQVDFELGRQFFVSKFLTLRPFIGLRSAWIFQKYDTELKGAVFFGDILLSTLDQKAKLKNKFWGFGFVTGLDSDWRLGQGFSIYADADMSILMSYFDVDQDATLNAIPIWSQDKSFRTGRAILDLGLGLKWATLFYQDRLGLTFKAGYEYHLYFNQNQFVLSSGNSNFELFNPVKGDLTYQGVIGSIQFDF